MKLTYKAIARMAGYRTQSSYGSYPNMSLPWGTYYNWYDIEDNSYGSGRFLTEQEAYKDCCKECGLVEDEK